jgi:hypothetical protein
MNDASAVRTLMQNAEKRGAASLVRDCQRRLFELGGINAEDPVERRLWEAVTAYEEILHRKHGKRQQASYTRRKIRDKGAIATLSDWALDTKITPGFEALVTDNLAEFTSEFVVVQFADRFEPHVVAAARKRLEKFGVRTV